MKKGMRILLTVSMLTVAAATTAFAEGPDASEETNGAPQMEAQQVPGNGQQMPQDNSGWQAPQMNDQQAPNDQPPQMNDQQAPSGQSPQMDSQKSSNEQHSGCRPQQKPGKGKRQGKNNKQMPNSQPPQMNGQQAPNDQPPQMNDQQAPNGQPSQMNNEKPESGFGRILFEDCVKDGTISQETCDAIKKYMDEHKPELQEEAKEGEKPELSEETASEEKPEMKEEERPDLLKDLLNDGVITQEEYEALSKAQTEKAEVADKAGEKEDVTTSGEEDKNASEKTT